MKTAPLQLSRYFVAELSVSANRQHDPHKPILLTADDLAVTPDFRADKKDARRWQVTLRIQQQGGPATNTTYFFTVELVGFFSVAANYPDDKVEWMVRTNASSVLYSTAREILRGAMSQGQKSCPLLLPTVSFYTPETKKLLDALADTTAKPKVLAEGGKQ